MVFKKENTNLFQQIEIYTYSSMKKYVEGVQKWKRKTYLMRESEIAT